MFCLNSTSSVSWTEAQEGQISKEYPFAEIPPELQVITTYLQFVWLPQVQSTCDIPPVEGSPFAQSLMPLNLLIPAIKRVNRPATDVYHPLHALIDPLLLTVRSSTTKYNKELPQVLDDGGAAGEMEEAMMWFALNHEKHEQSDEPWLDHKWRASWFSRLERRECVLCVQVYSLSCSKSAEFRSRYSCIFSFFLYLVPVHRPLHKKNCPPSSVESALGRMY